MPSYSVWYRNNPEPLEFATAYRCTELQILEHIFAKENIALAAAPAARAEMPVAAGPSAQELIVAHQLAPVRYTEDESEANTIG